MSEINNLRELKSTRRKKLRRSIDAVGCGVFFIWAGIALWADLGWGIGLIGVGLIILAGLAAKQYLADSNCYGATKANY